MPDHDPLAEALLDYASAYGLPDSWTERITRGARWDEYVASAIRDMLDAAGYEVRPKLTAERLAAALHPHYGPGLCLSQDQHEWPGCDRKDEWYSDAAAILAIIDGEAT